MKHPGKTIFYTQEHDYLQDIIYLLIYKGVPICGKKQVL
jgi:hypothetical protein